MEKWRLEKFKTLIGQPLKAAELEGEQSCEMLVSDVIESHSLGEGWESFSVTFQCDQQVDQGCFEFSHDEHGSTTLFVSPSSETELEAVFNYQL